ncbi:hypothetical protein HW132_36380 [Brasilonema sp. CT11]|nr:hypothetical protein [Brasilonema sp. CT11]
MTIDILSKVPRSKIDKSGMSLEDLHLFSTGFNIPDFQITPTHYPADKSTLVNFRNHLKSALQSKTSFVLINFLVDNLPGYSFTGGHWSPIAGYNPSNDLVLLCDVTHIVGWYPIEKIWNAINTKPCKCHYRGYVSVDAVKISK